MSQNRMQCYIDRENTYGAPSYSPLPVVLEKGAGCFLWDVTGKRYIDMMSAYSAVSLGHCHPEISEVVSQQIQKLSLCSRAFYSSQLGYFMEKLCQVSGLDRALPMNTGAEAVETGIKAARRWGEEVKGIPENGCEIIVSEGNFHGRTTTVISASTEPEYRRGFGPFTTGFKAIPFGDLDALEKAITPHTAAVLTEPMQGEGGIILPSKGWLKKVREACDRHQVLLILDEVQTGLGRTGKMFAFQHESILPDGLILGKALGGGVFPVSSLVGRREIMELFTVGSHGSTFGGNELAATIGLKTLEIIEREKLAQKSAEDGHYLKQQLLSIDSPLIKDVRGIGLWVGVEIDPTITTAREVCQKLALRGVLSKETHETVIRFAPPLTITREILNEAIYVFKSIVEAW